MSQEIEKRYQQYLDYVRLTTSRVARHTDGRRPGFDPHGMLPTLDRFSKWWDRISSEPATLDRWKQRLDAPEEYFEKTRLELRACLESLPLAPAA